MAAPPRRMCAGKRTGGLRPWQRGADKLLVPHRNGVGSPRCRRLRLICSGAGVGGGPELSSSSALPLPRIAAMGALVPALGFGGWGRKGGLAPPRGAPPAEINVSRPDLEPAIGPDG